MKVVIVGPGAIGLLLAGLLARAKEDVWLLDHDPQRCARLAKGGFRIEGLTAAKVASAQITVDPKEVADADLWFICVKSYDTKNVIKPIASAFAPKAFVCTLQNGLGNVELLVENFGPSRVLAGATNMGATLLSESSVRHAGEGETVIGRLDGAVGVELKDLRDLFQRSKLTLKLSRDIRSVIWSKLIINVGINALAALTRSKNGRLIEADGSAKVMREAVAEAVKVARRKRIKLLYDDALAKTESVCEATSDNVASMLQDVLAKKRTEIDFLNGAIVRQGESLGIKTPVNELLTHLVKAVEAGYAYQVH